MLRSRALDIARAIPKPPGRGSVREHQAIGVAFVALTGFRCLVADVMGVGKTLVAISSLSLAWKQLTPAVVICPSSVLGNWRKELEQWGPWFDLVVLEGGTRRLPKPQRPQTVYLVSWDLLHKYASALHKAGIRTVIADEAHFAKNADARRSRALRALALRVPHLLLLTGTPLENRLSELWHGLHLIDPQEFPTEEDFRERFVTSPGGEAALAKLLPRYMLRRLKREVLADLPTKTRTILRVDLPGPARAAYDKAEADCLQWMAREHREKALGFASRRYLELVQQQRWPGIQAVDRAIEEANDRLRDGRGSSSSEAALLRLGVLRRIVGEGKVLPALQWTAGELRAHRGPVVLFCEHQAVVKTLGAGLERMNVRWSVIDGSVGASRRTAIVDQFQSGQLDVLIGTRAMATGITLTRGHRGAFVERWWVPAQEEQAEDRLHRLGQTKAVEIVRLVVPGTVDDHVNDLGEVKEELGESVLRGEGVKVRIGGGGGSRGSMSRRDADVNTPIGREVLGNLWRRAIEQGKGWAGGADPRRPITRDELGAWMQARQRREGREKPHKVSRRRR